MKSLRALKTSFTLLIGLTVPGSVLADHVDWERWYEGDVETRINIRHGEGSVFEPGESIRVEFKTEQSAYHAVYGIDTEGYVRLLFPRFWEDDGWVPAGRKVRLEAAEVAWPMDRWGADGIVYLEVVASPEPFEWATLGFRRDGDFCSWNRGGTDYRISGDPFLAFNEIHQLMFPDWDNAVFTVDYTYFYVGSRYDSPKYLGFGYERVYVRPSHPRWYVNFRFGWRWHFGSRCARPWYRSYYRPGRHVVHHVHHVDYPASKHFEPYRVRDSKRVKHRYVERRRHRVRHDGVSRYGDVRVHRKESPKRIVRNEKEKLREIRKDRVRRHEVRKDQRKEVRKVDARKGKVRHKEVRKNDSRRGKIRDLRPAKRAPREIKRDGKRIEKRNVRKNVRSDKSSGNWLKDKRSKLRLHERKVSGKASNNQRSRISKGEKPNRSERVAKRADKRVQKSRKASSKKK